MIMVDHDAAAAQYGKGSPQAIFARVVYATAVHTSAAEGVHVATLEPRTAEWLCPHLVWRA